MIISMTINKITTPKASNKISQSMTWQNIAFFKKNEFERILDYKSRPKKVAITEENVEKIG